MRVRVHLGRLLCLRGLEDEIALAVLKSAALQHCRRRKVLPAKGRRESAFGLTIHLQPGATKPRLESPQWNTQHGASFGTRQLVEVGHGERLPKQRFHFS